jgi:hypothetical protein
MRRIFETEGDGGRLLTMFAASLRPRENPCLEDCGLRCTSLPPNLAVFGILFVFAPSVAERITATTHDPTLSLLYGQYTLTFAVVAFLAARENEAAGKLSLVILMLTAGHVAVLGYRLLTGVQAFSQAGAPLIVNFVLTALLFLFKGRVSAHLKIPRARTPR